MLMKAKASIRLKFPSRKQLETVQAALLPEVDKPSSSRTHVTLTTEEDCLLLNVEADDTVALRAALNSYLRWVNSLINVVEVLDNLLVV
jgi:tRNA threonylcarbamoyladenosine modification (KEOPS) complex  Pcc1 subunit